MQGDKIRIHRQLVVQRMIRQAEQQLALEAATARPIPTKVIVPLIEHASQEEPDDHFMINMWSRLLASSATTDAVSPRFVSILSELNSRQAALLLAIHRHVREKPFELVCEDILLDCPRDGRNLPDEASCQRIIEAGGPGLIFITGKIAHSGNALALPRKPIHFDLFTAIPMRMIDLDILESLSLIQYSNPTASTLDSLSLVVQYGHNTYLGDELLDLVGAYEDSPDAK